VKRKIYCIPGQGVDHRLFSRMKIEGAELIPIKWVTADESETMQSYARKLSVQIDTMNPFYLMGVSFGGMLCAEMCEFLSPEKTFIISSAKKRNELPLKIRMLKYFPVFRLFGNKFFRSVALSNKWVLGIRTEDEDLFRDMLKDLPENYFNYTARCIVSWARTSHHKNIIHFHGTNDKLIPLRKNMGALQIENGTHFMVLNDAVEISRIINSHLHI
jgi:hypothetical protein